MEKYIPKALRPKKNDKNNIALMHEKQKSDLCLMIKRKSSL
jgi:hypothetical protein